jgi:hypothetical protein
VDASSKDMASKEWLAYVAELDESDLRGHSVALTYHEYSHLLDEYVWGDEWSVRARRHQRRPLEHTNANWFNFGTWATATINRDIRHKAPTLRAQRVVPFVLRPRLAPALTRLAAADGQRVARALSWGQRLVFLSTTYTFLELRRSARPVDEEFVLPEGTAPDWLHDIVSRAGWDGHEALARRRHLEVIAKAFDCYRKARLLVDAAGRAQSDDGHDPRTPPRSPAIAREILLGNLLITAVEQDVVDVVVRQVVDLVPSLASAALATRLSNWAEWLLGVPRQVAALQMPMWLAPKQRRASELWARFMTDQILIMNLPTETLRLGRDMPPLRSSRTYYPADLADLAEVEDLGDLGALDAVAREDCAELHRRVSAFDRSRGDGRGTAAWDWRRYDDRMNWAVNLLRSRQQDPSLFWAPFGDEDRQRILNGRRPRTAGDPANYEVLASVDGSAVWPQ